MSSVQSSIHAKVKRREFPTPKGAEAFLAYVIAVNKGLGPEIENAAHQTLDHPMTFEVYGEGLQLFEGCALRDLASFCKRCRDNLVTCLYSFLEVDPPGRSSIWVGCPEIMPNSRPRPNRALPKWLSHLLSRIQNDLKLKNFTLSFDIHSRIRQDYFKALQSHANCILCLGVHMMNGSTFCAELEDKLAQARDKVIYPLYFLPWSTT